MKRDDSDVDVRGITQTPDGVGKAVVQDALPVGLAETAASLPGSPPPKAATGSRYSIRNRLGEGGMGVVYEAFDAQLDRLVALKVVHEHLSGSPDQLIAEARAMAKLSHPNVVTVFDVVTLDDKLHVAMELVTGGSLREWLAKPHGWREIVAMFVRAGHGLAAAHHAGLIHRDFKPANCLLDRDGRPRVSDFGLARSDRHRRTGPPGDPAIDRTADHFIAGTPAYMAPEQLAGAPVDARADQFSFCVALWEALFGERPYPGNTLDEISFAFESHALRQPRAGGAPAWVVTILTRGLAVEREDRYPELEQLLAALSDDPQARRRRRVVFAAVGATVLALGGATAYLATRTATDPAAVCDAGDPVAPSWGPTPRAAIEAAVGKVAVPHARETGGHVIAALDDYAARWTAAWRASCRNEVEKRITPAVREIQSSCFAMTRAQLGALATAIAESPDTVVRDGARIVGRLPAISLCERTDASLAILIPDAPDMRAAVEKLRARRIALEARQRVGRDKLGPEVDELLRASEAVGYEPLIGEVLNTAAVTYAGTRPHTELDAIYERMAAIGEHTKDPAFATEALILLANSVGFNQRRYDEGLAILRGLEPTLRSMEDRPGVRARALGTKASILQARGDLEQAIAMQQQARELAIRDSGPDSLRVAQITANLGNARSLQQDYKEAVTEYNRALAILEKTQGANHPIVAQVLVNLGDVQRTMKQYDASLATLERARGILAPAGPSAGLAVATHNLGAVMRSKHDDVAGLKLYREAREIWEKVAGPQSPQFAESSVNLARVLLALHQPREARDVIEPAVVVLAGAGVDRTQHVFALAALGQAQLELGEVAPGLASLDRAWSHARNWKTLDERMDVALTLARALAKHAPTRRSEARTLAKLGTEPGVSRENADEANQILATLGRP